MPAQQLQAQMNNGGKSSMEATPEKKEASAPVPEQGNKHAQEAASNPPGGRTTSRNRILGDYTLSKTLGAGSMGKVKLAHHNVTGEKVLS